MGKVPFPPFDDRPVTPRPGDGSNAGTTPIRRTGNTFWHTMIGNLTSTDAWFRTPGSGALTPWGIGGSLDGALDGKIYRWLDYKKGGLLQPWSSGPWIAPGMGDGPRYVDTFSVDGINGRAEAIEFSGLVNTPMTAKQWRMGIWLTAAIIHDAGRDSAEYLWNMHHNEICKYSGKDCPFWRIYGYTNEYQQGILYTLQHFEGKRVPDTITVAGLKIMLPFDAKDTVITPPQGPIFHAFKEPRMLTIGRGGATVRQWASRESRILTNLAPGQKVRFAGYYFGESINGQNKWAVEADDPRGRVHASGIMERDWE